jgi:hypothetical protein
MSASPSSRLERAILVGLPAVVAILLLRALEHDPASGVTFSNAPFSDEGWRAVNARNLVFFGVWATDDWAMHLLQAPLSVVQAMVFSIAGVGLAQARFVSVASIVTMAAILLIGLRRPLGLSGSVAASIAASTSALMLYYGRLALLEAGVCCALSVAAVATVRVEPWTVRRWAVVAGIAIATALAIKANAAAEAVGIVVAAVIIGIRERGVRAFAPLVVVVVTLGACIWLALVALPNIDALATMLPVLPVAGLPQSVGDWLRGFWLLIRGNDAPIALAWPLVAAAIISLAILGWDLRGTRPRARMPISGQARVALVGALWTITGLLAFGSLDYQPNRYFVPVLPGLALIVGAGVARVAQNARPHARAARLALFIGLLAFLSGPGILTDIGWTADAGRRAVDGQAAVRALLPEGAIAVGPYVSLFALTAHVQAIVPYPNTMVNPGDAYALGARWVFTADGVAPAWVDRHAAAWAQRRLRWCTDWGQPLARVCLFELP